METSENNSFVQGVPGRCCFVWRGGQGASRRPHRSSPAFRRGSPHRRKGRPFRSLSPLPNHNCWDKEKIKYVNCHNQHLSYKYNSSCSMIISCISITPPSESQILTNFPATVLHIVQFCNRFTPHSISPCSTLTFMLMRPGIRNSLGFGGYSWWTGSLNEGWDEVKKFKSFIDQARQGLDNAKRFVKSIGWAGEQWERGKSLCTAI